jgi:hypothetical protein
MLPLCANIDAVKNRRPLYEVYGKFSECSSKKVLPPENRSISTVAKETGITINSRLCQNAEWKQTNFAAYTEAGTG